MADDNVLRPPGAAARVQTGFYFSKLICEVAQAKYLRRKKEGDIKTLYEQSTMLWGLAPSVLSPQVLDRTDCARGRAVSKGICSPVTISHFLRLTFLLLLFLKISFETLY